MNRPAEARRAHHGARSQQGQPDLQVSVLCDVREWVSWRWVRNRHAFVARSDSHGRGVLLQRECEGFK